MNETTIVIVLAIWLITVELRFLYTNKPHSDILDRIEKNTEVIESGADIVKDNIQLMKSIQDQYLKEKKG